MKIITGTAFVILGIAVMSAQTPQTPQTTPPAQPPAAPTGYKDTPMQPNGKWRVHDDDRPRPVVVKPGPFVGLPAPSEVKGNSQGRGNSGVFLNGVFEIQVLDSYENKSYADGQAASMYGQFPPMVNASRPPGEWQSYDITFTGSRFNGTTLEN